MLSSAIGPSGQHCQLPQEAPGVAEGMLYFIRESWPLGFHFPLVTIALDACF